MPCALTFAFDKAGSSMAAKIAMIAMTTRSSMSVKAGVIRRKPVRGVVMEFFIRTIRRTWYYGMDIRTIGRLVASNLPTVQCQ